MCMCMCAPVQEKLTVICQGLDPAQVKKVSPMFKLAEEKYAQALVAARLDNGKDPVKYYVVP